VREDTAQCVADWEAPEAPHATDGGVGADGGGPVEDARVAVDAYVEDAAVSADGGGAGAVDAGAVQETGIDSSGCTCDLGGGGSGPLYFALLLLPGLVLRRRRHG